MDMCSNMIFRMRTLRFLLWAVCVIAFRSAQTHKNGLYFSRSKDRFCLLRTGLCHRINRSFGPWHGVLDAPEAHGMHKTALRDGSLAMRISGYHIEPLPRQCVAARTQFDENLTGAHMILTGTLTFF